MGIFSPIRRAAGYVAHHKPQIQLILLALAGLGVAHAVAETHTANDQAGNSEESGLNQLYCMQYMLSRMYCIMSQSYKIGSEMVNEFGAQKLADICSSVAQLEEALGPDGMKACMATPLNFGL
jgi:hypothetical protein